MKVGSQKKNGMIKFGENNIIILILDKSRSVAPGKLEIKLVWPKMTLIRAETSESLLYITISNQISLKGIRMCNFRQIVRVMSTY
jgi:hypothetical protein